ncbi:Baseplate protein (plasmid) [Rhodovastum atsumiense]|uniref:Baseplate protein n=1 Tax=Rhodovastum atsumiense TaxID=504468 RepID=A0A5M6IWY6_9PROT|nr:baseplate J/gp47 family protein [Rhodovastum atsumiense]KAA5611885.1 baseplate protein [Rhodovastum atsumiense]CAH2606136.1 Baseplate protein [Rhodovastum atsumiense]
MALPTVGFSDLVRRQAAAAQGAARNLLDFSVGSALRALVEASAKVALWLQWQALDILAATRLGSSKGSDVDSFVADFGMPRIAAVPASGPVTLARATPTTAAVVLVGGILRTEDASQAFVITADTAHPNYSAALGTPDATTGLPPGGYLAPVGTASISVPVAAQYAGVTGNVSAGTITRIGSGISGFDTASNAVAFTTGINAESDDAVKARFPLYIGSLSKATATAIASAVAGVQQGLTWSITENVDEAGASSPGRIIVTIDDGTGSPPDSLLASVYAAVDQVRAFGVGPLAVHRPTTTYVDIALAVTAPAAVKATLAAQVERAIATHVASLGIGQPLRHSRIIAIAYGVSSQVSNVSAVSIAGGTADIVPGAIGIVRASSITVS